MRSRSSAVLFALAVATLAPSPLVAQYTPKWRVGDWWIVKSRMGSFADHGWQWDNDRYDVLRADTVDGRACYVLQQGMTESPGSGPRKLYYVRTDDFRVVREVEYFWQAGKLIGPVAADFPDSTTGPDPSALLPLFPLDDASIQDSTFRLYASSVGVAYLRQSSGLADSAALGCYLSDPDTSRDQYVRAGSGRIYAAICESGTPQGPGDQLVPYIYNLQLWSEDLPWRLYWEWGQYRPAGRRSALVRSWLIAVGHKER